MITLSLIITSRCIYIQPAQYIYNLHRGLSLHLQPQPGCFSDQITYVTAAWADGRLQAVLPNHIRFADIAVTFLTAVLGFSIFFCCFYDAQTLHYQLSYLIDRIKTHMICLSIQMFRCSFLVKTRASFIYLKLTSIPTLQLRNLCHNQKKKKK